MSEQQPELHFQVTFYLRAKTADAVDDFVERLHADVRANPDVHAYLYGSDRLSAREVKP